LNGSPSTETVTFYEKEVVIYVLEVSTIHIGFLEGINYECANEVDVLDAVLKFR